MLGVEAKYMKLQLKSPTVNQRISASPHRVFGGAVGAVPSGAPGKILSKLISGGGGVALVVVKPIQRPRKMIVIQIASESTAVTRPIRGANDSLSQR